MHLLPYDLQDCQLSRKPYNKVFNRQVLGGRWQVGESHTAQLIIRSDWTEEEGLKLLTYTYAIVSFSATLGEIRQFYFHFQVYHGAVLSWCSTIGRGTHSYIIMQSITRSSLQLCFQCWLLGIRQSIFYRSCLSHSQISSVTYSSLSMVEALWTFPTQFGMVVGVILGRLMWSQSCWWDFMGVTSDIIRKRNLMANSLILWFWQCFGPVSAILPGPKVQECFTDVSIGTRFCDTSFRLAVFLW